MSLQLFLELPEMNQIKIDSFSLSKSAESGKKFEAHDANLSRTRDEDSTALLKAALNGQNFSEAVVVAQQTGEKTLRFRMKLAAINSFNTQDGVRESLSLNFTTLVVEAG